MSPRKLIAALLLLIWSIGAQARDFCPCCEFADSKSVWAVAARCDLVVYGKILNEELIAVFEDGKPVEDDLDADGKRERVALMSGELQILEVLSPSGKTWPDQKSIWVTFARPINWGNNMQDIFFEKALYSGSILMLERSATGTEISADMDVKYLDWLRKERDLEIREQDKKEQERQLAESLKYEREIRNAEDLNRVDPFEPTEKRRQEKLEELKTESEEIRKKLEVLQSECDASEHSHSSVEQEDGDQPAPRSESASEDGAKPKPEGLP